jgi:hypothetical protein
MILGSGLAIGVLNAQTAAACIGQTVPLQPTGSVYCAQPQPVCLTDPNGMRGHWIWSCQSNSIVPAPDAGTSRIPLAGRPPQITNPVPSPSSSPASLDYLRQLEMQTQQMQEQIAANDRVMASRVVTNKMIIAAAQSGRVSENGIISAIMASIPNYSLTSEDLATLRSAGVTEREIDAMMERTKMAAPIPTPLDLQAAYTCGYFSGMLSDMEASGLGQDIFAMSLRETLKDKSLRCDEVDKSIRSISGPH